MYLEQHRQAMLQRHLSDQPFYCQLMCVLYYMLDGIPCFVDTNAYGKVEIISVNSLLAKHINALIWMLYNPNGNTYIESLVQDCSNSCALAMELLQSCNNSSI